MKKQLQVAYQEIVSLENLFAAWQEFICSKRAKRDVREFGFRLADNILQLHDELANFLYVHGGYEAFNISDPKPRNIHKACVRDRVLHHAIYRKLYLFFDQTFIADSFSCRLGKGTHKALNRFASFGNQVSQNHTRTAWVLKCDIKRFFASVDHETLLEILKSYIPDQSVIWLLRQIIKSFYGTIRANSSIAEKKGLPLGNLTSQLFCNIYMNEFDQFVKHQLREKYYLRYADDFVFLSQDKNYLLDLLPKIRDFLETNLKLSLHPNKVFIKTLASGVDFLGWTHFAHYRILRKTSRKRMFKRIYNHPTNETLQSYLGLLKHGNTYACQQELLNLYGLLT